MEDNGYFIKTLFRKFAFPTVMALLGSTISDELDNVAGGSCYSKEGFLVVTTGYRCNFWQCKRCHSTETDDCYGPAQKICKSCRDSGYCPSCIFSIHEGGLRCTNPNHRKS